MDEGAKRRIMENGDTPAGADADSPGGMSETEKLSSKFPAALL